MAYLSKELVLKSYYSLSFLTEDHKQGQTQIVSAIRHFFALDMYYKEKGTTCDLKVSDERNLFIDKVRKLVNIRDEYYTTNFYTTIKPLEDCGVGSNFTSAGVVNNSRQNTTQTYDYPTRGQYPLFNVRNAILIRNTSNYKNITHYLSSETIRSAFVVWVLRNESLSNLSTEAIKVQLHSMFTNELVDCLLRDDDNLQSFIDGQLLQENNYLIDCSDLLGLFKIQDYDSRFSYQQIFYGAPGTGKSHAVKTETEAWEKRGRVVRTTFHPDSDYSTFVGAYKPTTESVQRYDIYNKPMTRDGVPVMEQIITYEFVEQAFLQAYIDAWKNREDPEFLVIEEINRGNCAQIFGDLFQLLDRGDNGYSEYAIRADKDLQKHLCKAFEDVDMADYPNVKTGKELLLPANLYIRATMNTSDQSLFPIDSAFKRRWDWKYVPIAKGSDNGTDLNWMVEVDGDLYDWWSFVKTINKHVFDTTNSEDKQLGFFFCKAKDNVISAETFVCKVIFYLWNDVFKDFGFDDSIFEDKEDSVNPKLSFEKFYLANGKVNEEKVRMFLKNLGMMPMEDNNRVDSIDYKTLFKINGKSTNKLNAIPYMAIAEYVRLHPDKTAQEVVDIWEPFKQDSQKSWIVCNKQDFDTNPTKYANYSEEIPCADGQSLWVNKDGWMHNPAKQRDTIAEFIKAVNEAGFGIRITEDAI